jgi:hypothetical protein
MTVPVTAVWMHGNAVVAEHPEHLLALDHRGWGPEFKLRRGTDSWFHIAIPTPLILENQRPQLVRVFLCFSTPEGDGHIREIHLYDGPDRFQMFENLSLAGDRRAYLMSGYNTFTLPSPRLLYWGLGISFLYQAAACPQDPCPPSYLSIAAAGTDFITERQRQPHEVLTQQQAPYEQDVAALREAFTGQAAQMREITDQQRNQHESLVALLNDTEALKGTMLAWQPRADTQDQQIAALRAHLQEEVQAREVLAQQMAPIAAQKTTQRRRKPEA